jgi:phosphotransferase system HPr (HPr) family protein
MSELLEIRLHNKVGLHARPASLFVQTASKFSSNILVHNKTTGSKPVNAKSILSVLTLGAANHHEICIQAEGSDAQAAIQSLKMLIEADFGEQAGE